MYVLCHAITSFADRIYQNKLCRTAYYHTPNEDCMKEKKKARNINLKY